MAQQAWQPRGGAEPCINASTAERTMHGFESTGLDVVGDTPQTTATVYTRRCAWCQLVQHKTYGRPHAAWRDQSRTTAGAR